jgi:hypothetical protein
MSVADKAEANKAIGAEKANEAIDAIVANCRLLLDNGVTIVHYLPSSLTKYSAFFLEDKVYFGIFVDVRNNNLLVVKYINQLVGMVNIVERCELVVAEGRADLDELNVTENLD